MTRGAVTLCGASGVATTIIVLVILVLVFVVQPRAVARRGQPRRWVAPLGVPLSCVASEVLEARTALQCVPDEFARRDDGDKKRQLLLVAEQGAQLRELKGHCAHDEEVAHPLHEVEHEQMAPNDARRGRRGEPQEDGQPEARLP